MEQDLKETEEVEETELLKAVLRRLTALTLWTQHHEANAGAC